DGRRQRSELRGARRAARGTRSTCDGDAMTGVVNGGESDNRRNQAMNPNDSIQRGVLPIPDRKPVSLTTYDAKDPDTKFPPIVPLRPPTGAPNVLVILLDDVGFGASSAFGGPCRTPT